MIKRLQLYNFQSHKDSELNFVPGLNVIAGQSDSGKTAILRGLYWLSYNKPSGDSFINNKIKSDSFCGVSLDMDEVVISREKGKKVNSYFIGSERQDMMEELKAFGQEVPEEVSKALNFDDINIQRQMDSPFLLSDTPGEVAKFLNKVTNLDVIDKCLSNLASFKRTASSSLKSIDAELASTEKEISELDYLDKAQELLFEIEAKNSILEDLENKISGLEELLEEIEEWEEELKDFKDLSGADKIIDDLIIKMKEQEEVLGKYNQLSDLCQEIDQSQLRIFALDKVIERDEKELHKNIEICPLCGRSE